MFAYIKRNAVEVAVAEVDGLDAGNDSNLLNFS